MFRKLALGGSFVAYPNGRLPLNASALRMVCTSQISQFSQPVHMNRSCEGSVRASERNVPVNASVRLPRFDRVLRMTAFFVGALTSLHFASGQVSESKRSLLLGAASAAKSQLNARLLPNRKQATEAFMRDSGATIGFFEAATSRENGANWLRYLELDPLRDAIDSDASIGEQGRRAVALRARLIGIEPGLELRNIVQLRRSVENLIAALRFADADNSIEQIEKQIETLEETIEEMAEIPSPDDLGKVAAIVSLLHDAGQATQAVQTFRSVFGQSNAVFTINERLVQQAVNRAVNQSQPVRDCILGTRLVGMASLNGTVTADLQPSIGAALLSVSLQGQFSSSNRGYNGPVVLNTVGVGQVFATRNLLLNESGVSAQPAFVRANLSSQIQSIEHRLRIVRRIAKKKAAEQKPQADRIAVDKLRRQVGEQFIRETNESQAMAPADPLAKVRPWLGRLDLVEPTRTWGSSFDTLYIQGLLSRSDQLGSPVSPPPVTGVYDIAVQIHETLVDNAVSPLLAGRTVSESDIEPLLAMSGMTKTSNDTSTVAIDPLALERERDANDEAEPPFEIDFARVRPVIFEAREGRLRVGVRGTRFAQGQRELSRAMEITAEYVPAIDPSGNYLLIRDGDVGVTFPGRGRLTISQSAIKTTIQKSFAEVFPPQIADKPIIVPPDAPLDAIRGRVYRPSQIRADNGWLSVMIR